MQLQRASGILLHPTSLPSRYGIGDLGANAQHFIDFLAETGQRLWQVLPLNPIGFGNSPYLAYSAFASNHYLLDPDRLVESGLLARTDGVEVPEFPSDRVDYDRAIACKVDLLRRAFGAFKREGGEQLAEYREFNKANRYWLDDYALFMALKGAKNESCWYQWESELVRRDPEALDAWRDRLSEEIAWHKFLQFEVSRQWGALKQYANDRGIQILGDIPIYVAHDSAEVWAYQEFFALDRATYQPALMAGVPPDYFSETGQLWGNPVYNWDKVAASGYEWWVQRFKSALDRVDLVRIDHFRGFEAFWAIPAGETTAINGEWRPGSGAHFFEVLGERLGKLPIVAEDLGLITDEVIQLRDRFEFPGMKILQFAFDSGPDNPYLPANYHNPNCIVYTGTHDNDTTVGWFEQLSPEAKEEVGRYLGGIGTDGIHWSLIRYAMHSPANVAIVPLQDVLGLGPQCRMNCPGTQEGNWLWRYTPEQITQTERDRLGQITRDSGRA